MKLLISNILVLLILTGCNNEEQQSSDTDATATHDHGAHGLHEMGDPRVLEVMAIHDSIMPYMSTIMDLKQKITSELRNTDSLLTIKSSEILKTQKEKAFALHIQLDKADKEMMNWMHQYRADTLAKLGKEEGDAYISDQKQKIEAVRDQMDKSIRDARAFIEKK